MLLLLLLLLFFKFIVLVSRCHTLPYLPILYRVTTNGLEGICPHFNLTSTNKWQSAYDIICVKNAELIQDELSMMLLLPIVY